MGGDSDRGLRRHAQRVCRGGVLVARCGGRPLAPLRLHHRCGTPLRARRRSGADGRTHRAHHAADHRRSAAARRGRWTTRSSTLPQRKPVTLRVDRAAKVIGMPVTQPQCAAVFERLGLPLTRAAGHDQRDAAELALRPEHRGRPDRGSRSASSATTSCRPTPPLAPVTARALPEARRSAQCAAPCAGGARLPGDHQLQLRRGALGARAGRQHRSDPRAESDRRAAGGHAIEPASAAWSTCCATTWRARRCACACSKSAACYARDPSARRRRYERRRPAPAGARGRHWPTAAPTPLQWGASRTRRSTSSTSRATSRRCSRRAAVRFVAAEHPALHPGPQRAHRARWPRRRA